MFNLFFILMMLLMVAFIILIERNLMSLSQIRKSPNIISIFSILQTLMDSMKLLMKKMHLPIDKNFFLFFFGPVISIFISIFLWFFIPYPYSFFKGDCSMLLFFFFSSIHIFSILWSGWGSKSSYSMISSIRCVAQMISYEVVLVFLFMLLMYKFSMFNFYLNYYYNLILNFFFFYIFFFWILITLAENNRTPFDLVESESELVGSYNVEYSSSFFTFLFLSEYINIWIYSIISGFFFFFFSMISVFIFLMMIIMIRFVLPRLKYLDLILLCWFSLLPMMMVLYLFILYNKLIYKSYWIHYSAMLFYNLYI